MIENEISFEIYTCNGSVKNFDVPFKFFKNADGAPVQYQLAVFCEVAGTDDTVKLKEGQDYSVTYNEEEHTGTVVTSEVYPANSKLGVWRDVINTQEVRYDKNAPFPYEGTEHALDKITMSLQELKAKLKRAIALPETSVDTPATLLQEIYEARDNAKDSAAEAAVSASKSESEADLSEQHASAASKSKDLAAQQAIIAQGYKENCEAILAQVDELLKQVAKLGRNWLFYVAGTPDPSTGYDGSLNTFIVPQLMEYNTGSVYINGVYKTIKQEYNVVDNKIVLTFDCAEGDNVAIAWQADVRDNALYLHENDENAHPKIQAKIEELWMELRKVITQSIVNDMIASAIKSHNDDKASHGYILSLFNKYADKAYTYNSIDEIKKIIDGILDSMITVSLLDDYYKKTGGPISGQVAITSSSDYILELVKSGLDNKFNFSIDKEGTLLIMNKDSDGAHGIEVRKDGSLYIRQRIIGVNGYDTKRILTEDDLVNIQNKFNEFDARIKALEKKVGG